MPLCHCAIEQWPVFARRQDGTIVSPNLVYKLVDPPTEGEIAKFGEDLYTMNIFQCLGIDAAVKKFANFDLETLIEPALYFAKHGFKIPDLLAVLIKSNFNNVTLLRTEEGKQS